MSGPPDYSARFNTPLSPADESAYQAWVKGTGKPADVYDYDQRGFWQAGAAYAPNGHGGDTWKKPNHPTFSTQSRYNNADGGVGGTWGGGNGKPSTFQPSATNLMMYGADGLRQYFNDREQGNTLVLPQAHGFGGAIRRDDGGAVPQIQTLSNQNPLQQQAYQHYAGMTEEQLQELALRARGSPQGAIVQRVLQQRRMTPPAPPQQATDPAAGPPETYALGGMLEAKGGIRMPERGVSMGASPPSPGGLFHTAGPGRTDNLRINPKADSYIVPADAVSGIGQGSTLAGAKMLDMMFKSGPYGAPLTPTHVGHRMGAPRAPAAFHSDGGQTKTVPVVVAGGEYLIPREGVQALGHSYCKPGSKTCSPAGDIARGHDILDAFVLHARKKTIKDLQGLKGPVKS